MSKSIKLESMAFKAASKFNLYDNVKNGIAYWGENNDIPVKYLETYGDVSNKESGMTRGSTWNTTAIDGTVKLIISDGFAMESDGPLPNFTNDVGDTYNELLEKISYDWKILGGFAIEVIYEAGSMLAEGDIKIAELYHIPIKNCRAQEKNYRGQIEGWYVSDRWGKRNRSARSAADAEFLPSFNPSLVKSLNEDGSTIQVVDENNKTVDKPPQRKQILVVTRHNPNNEYYPEPDYKGGLIDIFTDSLIRKSKISMLNNSIVASSIIQVVTGGMSPEDKAQFLNDLEMNYSETLNHGAPMVMEVTKGDSFHQITPPGNAKNTTEAYTGYEPDIRQRILSSHQITFSEIVGIAQENAGLSREQIVEKFNTFMQMTIRPSQTRILSGINKLSAYLFENGDSLVINPIDLFQGLEEEDAPEDVGDQETDTTLNIQENGQ